MDSDFRQDLDQLVYEVFDREETSFAELRLSTDEAEKLTQHYNMRCVPMDDTVYSDGKRWYNVWRLTL